MFLPDGDGLRKLLVKNDTVTRADSPWTLYAWIYLDETPKGLTPIAGLGDPEAEYSRYLGTDGNMLILWAGKENSLSAATSLAPRRWHFVAATFDGHEFQLFSEGSRVANGKLDLGSVAGVLEMAPTIAPWTDGKHLGGKIAALNLLRRALTVEELKTISQKQGDFQNVLFEEASKPWPFQTSNKPAIVRPKIPLPCRVPKPRYLFQ